MSDDDKLILTADQAIAMLPDSETVHTFLNPCGILVGADWSRADLLAAIATAVQLEVGGEMCQRMNHGLVVWTRKDRPMYCECREGVDYENPVGASVAHNAK